MHSRGCLVKLNIFDDELFSRKKHETEFKDNRSVCSDLISLDEYKASY